MTNTNRALPLEEGDFIRIPVWNVSGQVVSVDWDHSGLAESEDGIVIMLQRKPEAEPRRYRLEPGSYVVEN
jgi:hypothetical protein